MPSDTTNTDTEDDTNSDGDLPGPETILRHGGRPAWEREEFAERIAAMEAGEDVGQHRSYGFDDEADYTLVSDISMAVADIVSGQGHYSNTDLCVCPECGHEATLPFFVHPDPRTPEGFSPE